MNAEHLSDEVKRRFYRNYFKSKKKAFSRYAKKYADGKNVVEVSCAALKCCGPHHLHPFCVQCGKWIMTSRSKNQQQPDEPGSPGL